MPEDRARPDAGQWLDVSELVARLEPALMPVPSAADFVCGRCHSSKTPGYRLCLPCQENQRVLHGYGNEVVPISMSLHMGRLHDHLRQYKDSPEAGVRYQMATALGGLLVTYLTHHARCLSDWDLVCTVPSDRISHPLYELIGRVRTLCEQLTPALVANPALRDIGRRAHPSRYVVVGDAVRGSRVLLIDDTFTSGGSLQSAAYALAQAGASSVAPLVLGRHINPHWQPSQTLLARLRDEPWDWGRCVICGPTSVGAPRLL